MSEAVESSSPQVGKTADVSADSGGRLVSGTVISDRMDKTVTVSVSRRVKHPRYGKYVTRSSRLHVHDENNECSVGDTISFTSCRPFSKTKSWKLVRVVRKAD